MFVVVWGEEYEEACRRIDPRLHGALSLTRGALAANPFIGTPLIDGGTLYYIEADAFLGLLEVRLAYAVSDSFVVLLDVQGVNPSLDTFEPPQE